MSPWCERGVRVGVGCVCCTFPAGGGPTGRIIGGLAVEPQWKYPFIAFISASGQPVCGGSVIGPRVVLTAGHCGVNALAYGVNNVNVMVNLQAPVTLRCVCCPANA